MPSVQTVFEHSRSIAKTFYISAKSVLHACRINKRHIFCHDYWTLLHLAYMCGWKARR